MSDTNPDEITPDSKIAKQLGVHPKSLPRWDRRPELNFPKPIFINGRKYRRQAEIREFLRHAAIAHAASKTSFKA
jgi:hypothetical protein